eukprot:m.311654 g.311654  ORF g.311654 m.311654 type:complete len:264 (+) comp95794_c0_seq1:101-892(+)
MSCIRRLFSNKALVNGVELFYRRSGGNNSTQHGVLCLPGALGTGLTDFGPQLKTLAGGVTLVAPDPRGYGRSRPPERYFSVDMFKQDALDGIELMNRLQFSEFSVMGWSDGAITALVLASLSPLAVRSLVIWGGNAFFVKEDITAFEKTSDTTQWSPRMRDPLVEIYGAEELQRMWSDWMGVARDIYNAGGDICKGAISSIKAPVYLLHGAKDPMVPLLHPEYLKENLGGQVKYHEFPDGKHNIHLRYADEFNAMVADFLKNV